MNVLYVHSHDTGRFIEPYGHPVPTPSLARFARTAVQFRQAFCAAPTCSPSRAALLTGRWAHSSGMTGLAHRGFRLADPRRHLAAFLARSGFETVLCGIQHEGPDARELGYGRVLPDAPAPGLAWPERDTANAESAAAWLRARGRRGTPFFLSFGMFATHREYPEAGPEDDPGHLMPPSPLPDAPEVRADCARYHASARQMDRCFGIVMEALASSGLAGDTVVLSTTDHGIAFPHMKCTLYDTGIGVSLMLRVPGIEPGVREAMVSQVDVYPTLCGLLGLERPPWLQGVSLEPVLRDPGATVREELFAEVTYHAAYEPMRCVRTPRNKLIRLYDGHDRYVPANIDDGPSKSLLVERGLLAERRERTMLFDLSFDPNERRNLAADPRHADTLHELSSRLDGWMRETSDPLLGGSRVPRPPGARVNRLACVSPREESWEE